MKKVLSVLLALSVLLCASLALAEAADPVGMWYLNSVSMDNMSFAPTLLGIDMTVDLHADGSAELTSGGDVENAVWELKDGSVMITDAMGNQAIFVYGDGVLSNENQGLILTFGREPSGAPEIITISEPLAAESADAFNGVWGNAFIDEDGLQIPLSSMGFEASLDITGDMVIFTSDGEAIPLSCSLQNGMLTSSGENFSVSISLHEGDVVRFILNDSVVYFTRVAEEAAN